MISIYSVDYTILRLVEQWEKRFPSLQDIPNFVTALRLDIESREKAEEDPLLLTELPKSVSEIWRLHYIISDRIVSKRFATIKEEGYYQTNSHLSQEIVNRVCNDNYSHAIDPTCGTGSFLIALLMHEKDRPFYEKHIVGVERDPESALVAWFLASITKDLLGSNADIEVFVEDINDFISKGQAIHKFDILVGNPPWITWTELSTRDKERWKREDLQDYRFIEGSGMERKLGKSNKDIGAAIVLRVLQELGSDNARFGFLFKNNHMNSPTMMNFREGVIPHKNGRKLKIDQILRIESDGNFIGGEHLLTEGWIGTLDSNQQNIIERHLMNFVSGKWKSGRVQELTIQRLPSGDCALLVNGPNLSLGAGHSLEIRHGIKHDCADVFEITKEIADRINWQCVYPTVKSRHIKRDGWHGEYNLVLIPNKSIQNQSESQFANLYPLAYHYLLENRKRLEERKSKWVGKSAFYTIFGVGDYSFKSYKVAWVRLGWKPIFVVLSPVKLPNGEVKPVVPGDHFLFIPTENKVYATHLAEILNDPKCKETIESLSPKGKSSIPKRLIMNLSLPTESEYCQNSSK